MKKQYVTPALQVISNPGTLSTDQIAELPEDELADYLQPCEVQTYRINPNYVLRQIAGSTVIVPVGQVAPSLESAMLVPNKTAAFLWKLFQRPITKSEAVQKSKEQFDGPANLIEQNINQFIRELTENGILLKEER